MPPSNSRSDAAAPIARPGIFPTSGAPNPTYIIFALSLRGAENVAKNWGNFAADEGSSNSSSWPGSSRPSTPCYAVNKTWMPAISAGMTNFMAQARE
jgi:hypothetical protein